MHNSEFQPLPYPQTPESAKAYFIQHGINRSEWARHFGIDQQAISGFSPRATERDVGREP